MEFLRPTARTPHYKKIGALNSVEIGWNHKFSRKNAEPAMKKIRLCEDMKKTTLRDDCREKTACVGCSDDTRKIITVLSKPVYSRGKNRKGGDSNMRMKKSHDRCEPLVNRWAMRARRISTLVKFNPGSLADLQCVSTAARTSTEGKVTKQPRLNVPIT